MNIVFNFIEHHKVNPNFLYDYVEQNLLILKIVFSYLKRFSAHQILLGPN